MEELCQLSRFTRPSLSYNYDNPLYSLLPIVFCLVLLYTIATYLGCATLSANVTIIVAVEALFYPIGMIIELALVNMAILHHSSVNDSVSHF